MIITKVPKDGRGPSCIPQFEGTQSLDWIIGTSHGNVCQLWVPHREYPHCHITGNIETIQVEKKEEWEFHHVIGRQRLQCMEEHPRMSTYDVVQEKEPVIVTPFPLMRVSCNFDVTKMLFITTNHGTITVYS